MKLCIIMVLVITLALMLVAGENSVRAKGLYERSTPSQLFNEFVRKYKKRYPDLVTKIKSYINFAKNLDIAKKLNSRPNLKRFIKLDQLADISEADFISYFTPRVFRHSLREIEDKNQLSSNEWTPEVNQFEVMTPSEVQQIENALARSRKNKRYKDNDYEGFGGKVYSVFMQPFKPALYHKLKPKPLTSYDYLYMGQHG